MRQLAAEYARIARKIIIVGGNPPDERRSNAGLSDFAGALRENGAKTMTIPIRNSYAIALPPKAFWAAIKKSGKVILRHHYPYTQAIIAEGRASK